VVNGAGYAFDDATCPPGTAPTGGSADFQGGETGGTLGIDYGSSPDDIDSDGFYDDWFAYVYNSSGTASVYATAVCAPAGSATLAARAKARPDPRLERLRAIARGR
jgi:hypothetical protein